MQIPWITGTLILFLCALLSAPGLKAEEENRVVAVVNGIEIRHAQLMAGVPKAMKKSRFRLRLQLGLKLERLIDQTLQLQFLKMEGIEVSAKTLDALIARHQSNDAPSSCPCGCSKFKTLNAYLASKMMTLGEYRDELTIFLGMARYLEAEWKRKFASEEELKKELRKKEKALRAGNVKLSGIFFLPRGKEKDADVLARAEAAFKRLTQGESYETLAKTVSDDPVSKPKGGDLGCQSLGQLMPAIRKAAQALRPGAWSEPVKTWKGWVIVLRRPLTEKDLARLLRLSYERTRQLTILDEIRKAATIEKRKG